MLSAEEVKRVKERYTAGTRVKVINMVNDDRPVKSGTLGTVTMVDDIGQIHVDWDDGRYLSLIPEADRFVVV